MTTGYNQKNNDHLELSEPIEFRESTESTESTDLTKATESLESNVLKKVNLKKIFSKILNMGVSEISLELSSETCSQWDSIAHIDIIIELEKVMGKSIGPEKVSELISYEAIVKFLEQKGFVVSEEVNN
jgi:acyl carrier protein